MASDKSYSVEQRLNGLIAAVPLSPAIQFTSFGSQVNPLTDHSMGNFPVPANDMRANGATYEFVIFGHAGFGTLSPVLTFKLWVPGLGGTVLYNSGNSITCWSGGAAARIWSIHGHLIVNPIGASGAVYCVADLNEAIVGGPPTGTGTAGGPHPGIADSAPVDTTAPWNLAASCVFDQSSGAHNAGVLTGSMWRRF